MFILPRTDHRKVVFDPRTKLVEVLDSAQEYLDLAIKSKDRGEREFFERIVDQYGWPRHLPPTGQPLSVER